MQRSAEASPDYQLPTPSYPLPVIHDQLSNTSYSSTTGYPLPAIHSPDDKKFAIAENGHTPSTYNAHRVDVQTTQIWPHRSLMWGAVAEKLLPSRIFLEGSNQHMPSCTVLGSCTRPMEKLCSCHHLGPCISHSICYHGLPAVSTTMYVYV